MKVLGVCGSPRKNGNAAGMLKLALKECAAAGHETELVELAGKRINYCGGCSACPPCNVKDAMQAIYPKLEGADAVIIASPTYFAGPPGLLKSFMDRTLTLRRKNFALKGKIGAVIVVGASRNGGQENVCRDILNWMLIHDMTVVGDGSPTAHFGGICVGRNPGEAEKDEAGVKTVVGVGKRVAQELAARSGRRAGEGVVWPAAKGEGRKR
ncbi:MAG: flavodoxin family protein [Candidatus Micrarchaeota archaeon]|nr:flavodoxin family protein [Candidatus Micrarchaeota archaeon]